MILSFFIGIAYAANTTYQSEIFNQRTSDKSALYLSETKTLIEGNTLHTQTELRNISNRVLIYRDKSISQDGQLLDWKIDQLQTGETGRIQIKKGSLQFEYKHGNGKALKASEKIEKNIFVGDTSLIFFIQKNWKKLNQEQSLKVRWVIWEKAASFAAEITKKEATVRIEIKDTKWTDFQNSSEFYFSEDGSKILKIKGRSLAKVFKENKWQDFPALVEFKESKAGDK